MNKTKKIMLPVMAAALVLFTTACSQLDVVGKESAKSFDAVLAAAPGLVEADEANAGWTFRAPDGTVRFIWSGDWSKSSQDVLLELDAQPFLDAGLDPEKLPDQFSYNGELLTVGIDLGDNALGATALAAYEQIVELKREHIGYHMAMDHYGVNFGDGNMFEWAKDVGTNDKDIVFVLEPKPFIDAGVRPDEVDGWLFAKVETMDDKGKTVEVDKLLKPFDLQ
ncbi:MAG: hypothetical protein AAGU12_15430 [Clostridiales bacterium]